MGPDPNLNAGKSGNYWSSLDEWPTHTPTHFALTPDGRLDPSAAIPEAQRSYDYDPTHPVPTLGGNNLEVMHISRLLMLTLVHKLKWIFVLVVVVATGYVCFARKCRTEPLHPHLQS